MYLVQPAVVTARNTWKQGGSTKSLLKALNMHVSGHPGLSDGAVPDALLRFINARSTKIFGSIKLPVGELDARNHTNKPVTLHYLVREEQESRLRTELADWVIKAPPLAIRVAPAAPKAFMFCIDLNEECFFWNAEQGRRLIEETLPESAAMFRLARKAVRPTATNIEGILNTVAPHVEDRYTRMERLDE